MTDERYKEDTQSAAAQPCRLLTSKIRWAVMADAYFRRDLPEARAPMRPYQPGRFQPYLNAATVQKVK